MPVAFGTLLRKFRTDAGMSVSKLAKRLRVTTGFLSGVELGNLGALAPGKIHEACLALELDNDQAEVLHAASAHKSGYMRLDVRLSEQHARVAAILARKWHSFGSETLERLELLLDGSTDGLDND